MEKIKQVCLAFFVAALLGTNLMSPALAEDGGDDGGFDDGGADDVDDDNGQNNDQDKDGDGRPDMDGHGHKDGHGHHGKHHHHRHIHPYYGGWPWGFGPAFGYMPPYYPPAYYGYPPAAGRFVPPAVYIERKDVAQPAQSATGSQANFWHYCRSAEGYYPQVKECPDGWEQVAPTPQADKNDQE